MAAIALAHFTGPARTAGSEWVAKTWTTPNAPSGPFTDLAVGAQGFLLVASGEGLRRFDGISFGDWPDAPSTESQSWQATAVMAAQSGDIWIGFRGEGVEWRKGRQRQVFRLRDHESLRFIRGFWEDKDGAIWIGSEAGLAIFRGGKLEPQPLPPGQVVYRIKASPDGAPWLATDLGLFEAKNGEYAPVAGRGKLRDARVRDFVFDREGALWIATMGGVARLHNGAIRHHGREDGLAGDWVRRLALEENGRLWAACHGGVSWMEEGRFKTLQSPGLNPHLDVTAILPSPGGELWVTTSSGDLIRVKRSSISLMENPANAGSSHLLALTQDFAGNLWLGWNYFGITESGSGGNFVVNSLGDRPLNRPIALWPARAGGVWCAGTDSKLARVTRGQMFPEEIEVWPDGTALSSVVEDRQGRLWVGSFDRGLARRKDGRWTLFDETKGLGGKRVQMLHEDAGGIIWAAAEGLHRFENERFVRYATNGANPFGEITCAQNDGRDALWIGSHGAGLFRVHGGRWRQYQRRHGLVEDVVHGIVDDGEGRLWLQGPNGVTRIRKSDLAELDEGRRREAAPDYWSFTEHGLITGAGVRHPICARLNDGRIAFATSGGAAIFQPDAVTESGGKTCVHLERALVNGQSMDLSVSSDIPAGARRLALYWSAVNLSHPENLRFRHRLAGLDSDWLEDGALREAHYGALPAGQYRFELQVRNAGENWKDAIGPALLRQLPRWHERWTVRLSFAAALILAWAGFVRLRARQLERQFLAVEKERHRIAGELHDTVEQGLAGIAINLDAASRQLALAPERVDRFLAAARRLLTRSRDEARQSIWELRSVRSNASLVRHIERAVGDLLAGAGMAWEVKCARPLPRLEENAARRVLRIVLEAVTNAAKHSKASHLSVLLSVEQETLSVQISDNGRGFECDAAPTAGRYGLDLMRERAARLGGELAITSQPNGGTIVALRAPLRVARKSRRPAVEESNAAPNLSS